MRKLLCTSLLLACFLAAGEAASVRPPALGVRPPISLTSKLSGASLVAANTVDILTSRSLRNRGIGHETNDLLCDQRGRFSTGNSIAVKGGIAAGTALIEEQQAAMPQAAATPQPPKSEPAKEPADAATKQVAPPGGLMVFIDPATGKLREPTPAEIAALSRQSVVLPATAAVPIAFPATGGGVGAKLGADSLMYMVATRATDGNVNLACQTADPAAAPAAPGKPAEALKSKAPAIPLKAVR
jgi:hypothetical protein